MEFITRHLGPDSGDQKTMLDKVGYSSLDALVDAGLTCHSEAEAAVTRVMIGHARRVVGLATADKVGVRALAGICTLAALTDLVLSGTPDPALCDALREHEVRLHTV